MKVYMKFVIACPFVPQHGQSNMRSSYRNTVKPVERKVSYSAYART
jgi:hypothetical protein